MKKCLYFLSLLLPWELRRRLLCRVFGFKIHPTSRIGLSWIMPERLTMGADSRIGHLTVCRNLEDMQVEPHAMIGNGNWIYGFSQKLSEETGHFKHQSNRHSRLMLEEHAAITHRHLIDCTNTVRIGRFSTMAGYHSQILTHSIDLEACRQDSHPVDIGDYCLVGTNVVVLGGSVLPNYCVLGAKSLLNKAYADTHCLYGGVPAKPIRALATEMSYFKRKVGKII